MNECQLSGNKFDFFLPIRITRIKPKQQWLHSIFRCAVISSLHVGAWLSQWCFLIFEKIWNIVGWLSRLVVKVSHQGWSSRLIIKVGCQSWSSKLVVKVGRQGRSSRLVVKVGCQDWSLRLVIKAGRKDWSSRLVIKAGRQGWSSKLVIKVVVKIFSRLLSLHHRARVVGQFSICCHMTIRQGHQYEFFPLKYFRLDYFIQGNWPLGFAFNFNRRLLGTHIYMSSTFNWLQSFFKTTFSLYRNELSLNFNKSCWKWMCQNDMYSLSLGS